MLDPNGWLCDVCGSELIHLGRGEFICPNCNEEICLGQPEDWPDDEDNGYSYDATFGEKPEVCRTCGGEYPDCMDSCGNFQ